MKRGIIITIEILLLVALLQSSFAQYLLNDMQAQLAEWFLQWENYEENKAMAGLREATISRNGLNSSQQDYLLNITQSRDTLQRFRRLYCEQGDINPYFYGDTLVHFCHAIDSSGVLLDNR